MKLTYCVILVVISIASVSYGDILHYSVSGAMELANTDWSKQYRTEIYGDMYISDVDTNAQFSRVQFDIQSFLINADDFWFAGDGSITLDNPEGETWIRLSGPDEELLTGYGFPLPAGFDVPYDSFRDGWDYSGLTLPAEMQWPGFGWGHGQERLYRIDSLVLSQISNPEPAPIPEPATILLFGTSLVGLVGSRLRKKKQQ